MEAYRRELLQLTQQRPQQQVVEEEYEEDIPFPSADDELVETKHLKKIIKNQQRLEEQLRSQQAAQQEALITQRIKAQFPDFEKVVSTENVQKLNALYPEVAETLKLNPNLYSKAVSAYSIMKQYGIHREDEYIPQKQQAVINNGKPRTVTSLKGQQSHSPLAHANAFAQGLTPELQKQLWLEMEAARKRL
jgi:hemerythrin superfamily protein